MSLIKLATNALMRNWRNLSNEAKIIAGKAGMVRSERKYILGHIKGNKNILEPIKKQVKFIHDNNLKQGYTINLKNGNQLISNVHEAADLMEQHKLTPHLKGNLRHAFDAQAYRHELREAREGVNRYNSFTPKIRKIYDKNIEDPSMFLTLKKQPIISKQKANSLQQSLNEIQRIPNLLAKIFNGHLSPSVPFKDIIESQKNPHNKLISSLLNIRQKTNDTGTLQALKQFKRSDIAKLSKSESGIKELESIPFNEQLEYKDLKTIQKNWVK